MKVNFRYKITYSPDPNASEMQQMTVNVEGPLGVKVAFGQAMAAGSSFTSVVTGRIFYLNPYTGNAAYVPAEAMADKSNNVIYLRTTAVPPAVIPGTTFKYKMYTGSGKKVTGLHFSITATSPPEFCLIPELVVSPVPGFPSMFLVIARISNPLVVQENSAAPVDISSRIICSPTSTVFNF